VHLANVLLVAAACLVLSPAVARADAGTAETNEEATLAHDVGQLLAAGHVPGAVYATVGRGGLRVGAVGLADAESKRAATRETPFRVASISKMLVALVVLSLADEGKLALDTKVRDVLPALPFVNPWEAERPLRVADLLSGTTGWDDLRPRSFSLDRPDRRPLLEVLAEDPRPLTSRWSPGLYASYSNAGATAAAAVVEEVTHAPFEEVLAARIFAPLRMTASTFAVEADPRVARAYATNGAPLPPRTVAFRPSAGLASSAADMGALLAFLVRGGRGEGTLPSDALARLTRGAPTPGAREGLATAYGLGTQTRIAEGHLFRGHHGGLEGVAADLFVDARRGVGYFVATNLDDDLTFEAIAARLRAEIEGPEAPPSAPADAPQPLNIQGFFEVANPRFARAGAVGALRDLVLVRATGSPAGNVQSEGATYGGLSVTARAGHPAGGVFVRAGARGFRRAGEPAITLVARGDGALETADVALVPVPTAVAIGRLVGLVAVALALGSVPVVAAWRGIRARRAPTRLHALHVLPLVAGVSLALGLSLWATTDVSALGVMSARSVGIFAASCGLPLATLGALGSLVAAWRALPRARAAYELGVVVALGLVCAHLARFGLLFVRPWD